MFVLQETLMADYMIQDDPNIKPGICCSVHLRLLFSPYSIVAGYRLLYQFIHKAEKCSCIISYMAAARIDHVYWLFAAPPCPGHCSLHMAMLFNRI